MKMKEGTKITKHLNVFKTLLFQLTSMDIKIDDEHKEFNLLCTLPESWGRLVSSISLSTTDTLEFNTVICHLSSMDVKIDDENKVVNLLCTLADSWDQVVFSISL